ncbi:MAG: hypothetical protein LH606_03350 [Cytophagaceae bacterium]|nr:hypothetical protein [Cytophagaceae bacterium]
MRLLFLLLFSVFYLSGFSQTRFQVTFREKFSRIPLDGRLLLFVSTSNKTEPKNQVTEEAGSQLVFGVDVENWKSGQTKPVDASAFGYPIRSLSKLPAGDYWVQAFLHRYETFHRADGHTVKLPMDRGEGQQWKSAPGNLFSVPVKVRVDPKGVNLVKISLEKENPPLPDPKTKESKYVKHVKIRSEKLSKFWGRDMFLSAWVLLPEGFDQHPEARYPLCINHGHFPSEFGSWRESLPTTTDTSDYIARFNLYGYKRIQEQEAYTFYKNWTGPDFPRMLIIEIQHATPFYDDSYAVNSANIGPYGDAITYELIPAIEKQFRGIGQGWARFLYGGSTGGWEALAAQVFYPDEYGGCFAACPDPISFSAYTSIDLYRDKNAYFLESPWKRTPRPGKRDYLGHVKCTIEDMNHLEMALGNHSRSGGQWDIWEAVYSPCGPDGYPKRIFDKVSGQIDSTVALHWRENYDLLHIVKRDWAKLGPKLQGKIHLYCGDMDNYYLNNAVYLMEDFLKTAKNPTADSEVTYGDRAEHCWNGDPTLPNYLSRLHYNSMYVPKILNLIERHAPAGADVKSWRY